MTKAIQIADRQVGEGFPPYVVAEACINHQGDPELAKKMVYIAHAMGCDSIKFQIHVLDDEMLQEAPQSDNFAEPLYDTLEKTNLSDNVHRELMALCESLGIQYLCTPFSKAGVDLLMELGVHVFKVGSGELTNIPLQKHIASKGKPMIISTGMATEDEIAETVEAVMATGTPFILTHCVSAYPTPYNRVNLGNIPKYRDRFGVPVGLSDHSVGIYTSLGAVAHGACFVEKHFTLDRSMPGPDHESSLEPYELGELVKGCRAVFEANGSDREIFPEEREIVAWARETVVSEKDIPAGAVIRANMVTVKRPSPGPGAIPAKSLDEVIGKTAATRITGNRQIRWSDLEG
ncbi:MAG: N-acetylneuraminate synthase family protein [Pseudomonadota bacterium]|nr:N-acetylneuraminate synthase family protein [Pseudomonadota bacterium]